MDLWPLLVDDLLTGSYSVERQLRPRMVAVAARSDSVADAAKVITKLCSKWSGGAMPILSIDPATAVLDDRWIRVLQGSNLDGIDGRGLIPDEIAERYSDPFSNATQHLFLQLIESQERWRVKTCRGISSDHPWYISYLATFGDLPVGANVELNRRLNLRDTLRFDDLIDIEGGGTEAGAHDLLFNVCRENFNPAVILSRFRLPAGLSASYNKGLPDNSRSSLGSTSLSRKYGPNIVVVYRPDSVDDLALLWNLRARFAHPRGLPLAIPYSDSIAGDVDIIAGHGGAGHYFGFGHDVALTSFSVSEDLLRGIEADLSFDVVDPWELIGEIHGYCVTSTEVVQFNDGSAKIPDFSSTDIKELGQSYLGRSEATWLALTTIVKEHELPPSPTMRRGRNWTYPGYLRGHISHVGKLDSFTSVFHPSGLEILRALGKDRELDVRTSEPGRAAEQLIRAASGNVSMFASGRVVSLLSEMTRRGHASLVKRRLDQYLAGTVAEGTDRYEQLRTKLDSAIGSPDLEEVGYMTFNRIREILKLSKKEAASWVAWAIEHRILVRGFEASCFACGHRQWRALADAVPELVCHGCGRTIPNPFGVERIEHRYRASETLLRAMSSDVMSPILAMRYISRILGGRGGALFGAYPGIELLEPGSKIVLAEIDCLAVLGNGQWMLGECKSRARGLNEQELMKLWVAADRVGASVTFSATLDRATQCDELWRVTEDPNGRPHFSLTAEHLYDLQAIGPAWGEDLFEWRDDYKLGRSDDKDDAEAVVHSMFGEYLLQTQSDNQAWRRAQWDVKYD